MTHPEVQTKIAQVIARAWIDPQFKMKLKEEPRAALAEMGITLTDKVNMKVVEDTETEWYLYLPPSPAAVGDGVSTISTMSAGGSSSSGQCCKCQQPCV